MQSFPLRRLAAAKPEGGAQLRQSLGLGLLVGCLARDSLLPYVGEQGTDGLFHVYPFPAYT